MRKCLLAVLPLFWSCADNLPDPVHLTPSLDAIDFPEVVVAGWPEALVFRVNATIPAEEGWQVVLRVTGPGLDAPADYPLLDDGDFYQVESPGPGQEARSGDNVAGDGWFTARIAADFSAELGEFTLRARLLEGGVESDFRQVTRERLVNRAPEILSLAAPDTLASGGSFHVELTGSDPDGQDDLTGAVLTQVGGVMRSWPFTMTGDSLWTLTVGPELAAGRQGPDTLLVELRDRVGHAASRSLVVELENGPPALDESGLQQWHWNLDLGQWEAIALDDTLRFPLPASDTSYFLLSLPVLDPQTLADIAQVDWSISRDTTLFEHIQWFLMDDLGPDEANGDFTAGDGRYSAAMSLLSTNEVWPRILRIRAYDRVGQETPLLIRPVVLVPPVLASAGDPRRAGGRNPGCGATGGLIR